MQHLKLSGTSTVHDSSLISIQELFIIIILMQASELQFGSLGPQKDQSSDMDTPVRHDQTLLAGLLAPKNIFLPQCSWTFVAFKVELRVSKSVWSKTVARSLPNVIQMDCACSNDSWGMSTKTAWYRGDGSPSYKDNHRFLVFYLKILNANCKKMY